MKNKYHLWSRKHPYYCCPDNYFSNECRNEYESWDSFISEEGDADFDYNLLFRWDWVGDKLFLFWISQRKGIFRSTIVKLQKSDEKEVKKWLSKRFKYLIKLWRPLKL